MAIRAVIFDRDGVLTYFDFAPILEILRAVPLPFDEVRARWDVWCSRSAPPASIDAEEAHLSGFWMSLAEELSLDVGVIERLRAFDYKSAIRPFADARPTVAAVRARGLKVGVLSNFPMASLSASLASVGLLDLVEVAAAAPVIGASKPAAAAYRHVLEALGVEPHETLMVDDEEACVAGAAALGIHCFLLDRRPGASPHPTHPTLTDLGGVLAQLDSLSKLRDAPLARDGVALGNI